jgi:hypothetical protein
VTGRLFVPRLKQQHSKLFLLLLWVLVRFFKNMSAHLAAVKQACMNE